MKSSAGMRYAVDDRDSWWVLQKRSCPYASQCAGCALVGDMGETDMMAEEILKKVYGDTERMCGDDPELCFDTTLGLQQYTCFCCIARLRRVLLAVRVGE